MKTNRTYPWIAHHAARQGDDIWLHILVQIGDRDLVASLATGGDQMLGEFSGWSGAMRRPTKEQQQRRNTLQYNY